MSRTPRGFTLIELMVTVAVTVILLAVAVPSYINFMRSNKLSTNVNSFMQALQSARLEARGRGATLCPSTDQKKCDSADWRVGWIIFSDYNVDGAFNGNDEILRAGEAFPPGFTITTDTTKVTFGSQGFSIPAGATHSFEICVGSTGKAAGRLVIVNVAGSPASAPFDSCPAG